MAFATSRRMRRILRTSRRATVWFGLTLNRSPKVDVSAAPTGVDHAFPAIVAGSADDVRIAWMDQRNTPHWNVYYRTSGDGGMIWLTESTLSNYVSGYSYIFSNGFGFPFGDYFDLTIDYLDHTQASWGEGVWVLRQRNDCWRRTPGCSGDIHPGRGGKPAERQGNIKLERHHR